LALASHPAGTIVATTPVSSRPFGAAISRVQGYTAVTQLDAASLATGRLPATTFPTPIAVGFIPTNVTFVAGGTIALVTNQGSASVGVVNAGTGVQLTTIPVPMSPFNVAYCRSNKRAYVTGPGAYVYLINPQSSSLADSILTNAVTNGITTDANCSKVYVSDETNGRVLEISASTKVVLRTFATGGAPKDLALSPNGKRLYVADETGSIQLWNMSTGARALTVPLPSGAFGLAISPDGARVYAGMPFGGGVAVLDAVSNTVISTIPTGGTPRKIAFDASGATAIIANEGGWVDFVQ